MTDLARYKEHSGWQIYKGLNEHHGVYQYASGEDFILIQFHNSDLAYIYNFEVTGREQIEKMKEHARKGIGLSGFISRYVKKKYLDSKPVGYFNNGAHKK
jgi:hypothetical protein